MPAPLGHCGELIVICLHAGYIKPVGKVAITNLCRAPLMRVSDIQVVPLNNPFAVDSAVPELLGLCDNGCCRKNCCDKYW